MSVETMFGLILGTLTEIVFDPPVPKKKAQPPEFFHADGPQRAPERGPSTAGLWSVRSQSPLRWKTGPNVHATGE